MTDDAKAMEIATLEESIKTIRFEIGDKEWAIKKLEAEIERLRSKP